MMDLTKKALPNVIEIDGRAYSIYTDFRLWMRFEIEVGKLKKGQKMDVSYLFKNEIPDRVSLENLLTFSRPYSPLPRSTGGSGEIVFDYELDADYIYAAFLGQYGIDLMEIEELHWYKFLALFKGLNGSSKLAEIMSYRCYTKTKDVSDQYEKLKYAWRIERVEPEDEEEIQKFSDLFY
ncbi:MAG: hypothetical protein IJN92_09575 [Lachnospiraceae bacterium]|nr:hypothetical protein [Lachnospiraceae bacterium]